eukprot:10088155-Alexandrium_andersonii.AAC.1
MQLPCNAEGNNSVPSPSQPGSAAVLVAVAGPKGKSPESLHGGWEWAIEDQTIGHRAELSDRFIG